MSESREYYSRSEPYGDVYISEEVLEMIAGAAALEVEGVTGLAGGTMSEQLLGRKKLSKGITILWESDNITINVSIQILLWWNHSGGGQKGTGGHCHQRGRHQRASRWLLSMSVWAA